MDHIDKAQAHALDALQRQRGFPLHISQRKLLLFSVDLFLLNAALLLGFTLNNRMPTSPQAIRPDLVWFAAISLLWLTVASANDNYTIKQSAKVYSSVTGIIKSVLIMGAVLIAVPLVFPSLFVLWPLYLSVGIATLVWLVVWRVFYAKVLGRPNFKRRALIVGANMAGQAIAGIVEEHAPGYQIIGYISDDPPKGEHEIQGVARLGNWANLAAFVQNHGVSDIVLTAPRDVQNDRWQAILSCFEKGVRIVPMPELYEEITGRIPVEYIGGLWSFSLPIDRDSRALYLLVKRGMDIAIASIGLLVLAPIFPLMALAIRLDSPGNTFYRPIRQGQGGKTIRLWKFRTMVANADRIGDPTFTSKSDSRVTRVGRILRMTHVDELPQFINILSGEMSLVGPRPERYVPEMEEQIPFYRARNAVKPGATGWALVNQGYAEGIEGTLTKLQYDLYYIKHQSLTLDILILCKSVIHMLSMGGQ